MRHTSYVTCGIYHPDKPSVCVTGGNSEILVWDLRTPARPSLTLEYKDKFGQVKEHCLVFSHISLLHVQVT